jgi:AraC-like DNA-binding protein
LKKSQIKAKSPQIIKNMLLSTNNQSVIDYPLWQAEPELLQLHEQLACEKLQELARYDLVGEVRRAIGSTLESGETTLETVAAHLNITPRRLRTQLSEANTSFQQILSDYRCRLAKKLLANTSESVERIVYLTGFQSRVRFIVHLSVGPMKRLLNIASVNNVNLKLKNLPCGGFFIMRVTLIWHV